MRFRKSPITDHHLCDTSVENIFITEYMPDADALAIKVYLLALMCADGEESMSNELLSLQLGVREEDVLRCWSYWEEKGVIVKHYHTPGDVFHYDIEFISLREKLYIQRGKESKYEDPVKNRQVILNGRMQDDILRKLFEDIEKIVCRQFEGSEMTAITSWIDDLSVDPDVIRYAYRFCTETRKKNQFKYVSSVLNKWVTDGLRTVDDIEKHLKENDSRRYTYQRVMKACGFRRNPTEAEERIMDVWFDDWGASLETVLDACAKTTGISNPNLNYINKVVAGKCGLKEAAPAASSGSGAGTSERPKNAAAAVAKLYEEIRARNEAEAGRRKEEIYKKIPRISEIDNEVHAINRRTSFNLLSGGKDAKAAAEETRKAILDLVSEKACLLTESNYPPDYLDEIYDCRDCRDTGLLETGDRCRCYDEKLLSV